MVRTPSILEDLDLLQVASHGWWRQYALPGCLRDHGKLCAAACSAKMYVLLMSADDASQVMNWQWYSFRRALCMHARRLCLQMHTCVYRGAVAVHAVVPALPDQGFSRFCVGSCSLWLSFLISAAKFSAVECWDNGHQAGACLTCTGSLLKSSCKPHCKLDHTRPSRRSRPHTSAYRRTVVLKVSCASRRDPICQWIQIDLDAWMSRFRSTTTVCLAAATFEPDPIGWSCELHPGSMEWAVL